MLGISQPVYLKILILSSCFFLTSCLAPYSKPNALYTFNAVTDSPEGLILFNRYKRTQAILFYKPSLHMLYQADLFPRLNLDIRRCAEYVKVTTCVWYADIVLDRVEAEQYGERLFEDYWYVEDANGKFYIRSTDRQQRFQQLLNTGSNEIRFSYTAVEGNSEHVAQYLWYINVKDRFIEIRPDEVWILKKPSRLSRMTHIATQ